MLKSQSINGAQVEFFGNLKVVLLHSSTFVHYNISNVGISFLQESEDRGELTLCYSLAQVCKYLVLVFFCLIFGHT